jgi:hypothetical protein
MSTTTRTLHHAVAGEINTQKALAQGEIASLRAQIASPDTQSGWLPTLADDLAGQLAYASQLSYIESQLAATVRDGQDPRLALAAQLRWLANEASHLTDNGKRESREQVRSRATAIRAVTEAVYYALYDDLRDNQ